MNMDYATDFLKREDMIWKAMTAVNSPSVKDPIRYINRMTKKYGDIFKVAVGHAYETKNTTCYAVERDTIDQMLCAANGWKTIQDWRLTRSF